MYDIRADCPYIGCNSYFKVVIFVLLDRLVAKPPRALGGWRMDRAVEEGSRAEHVVVGGVVG
jgi:hypothetical protein